jgi:hypothetical protein
MTEADAFKVCQLETAADPETAAKLAVAAARDNAFADLMLGTLRNLIELRPDAMRTLIGQLFDLSAWEQEARKVRGMIHHTMREAQEARELVAAVRADFERLEGQLDGLRFEIEQMDRRGAVAL